MRLERRKLERAARDGGAISSMQADHVSRLWQAIAFVSELSAELSNKAAIDALQDGNRELIRGAHLLSPHKLEAVKAASSA